MLLWDPVPFARRHFLELQQLSGLPHAGTRSTDRRTPTPLLTIGTDTASRCWVTAVSADKLVTPAVVLHHNLGKHQPRTCCVTVT